MQKLKVTPEEAKMLSVFAIHYYSKDRVYVYIYKRFAELPIETSLVGDVEMKEARMPKPSAKRAPTCGAMLSR